MKTLSKLTLASFVLFSTLFAQATQAGPSRQYRKAWPKSGVTALTINNKFGAVRITDSGSDSVTVKVVISTNNMSESKAMDLINKIHISLDKSGGMVTGQTTIENTFNVKGSFSVDYLVNIPKDRDLNITNKYGNVVVDELEGKGVFSVSYGALTSGKIKTPAGSPLQLEVNYGKADLETVNDARMEISYSKLYADAIDRLTLDSRYSTINISKNDRLELQSKYDEIEMDELGQLKAASKYSHYKIGRLTGRLILDTDYGSVKVGEVDPKFERIEITNSYGGINLGLNGLNYRLKADCNFCDIDYPDSRYKGNKIRDNHRFSLEGNVGTGGGTVTIISRYGGVKLTE
jgi:hypothetical protein